MLFKDVSSDHFYRPCRPCPSGWFHWHGRTLPMASGICEMIYLRDLPTTQQDSPQGWHYIHVFYSFTTVNAGEFLWSWYLSVLLMSLDSSTGLISVMMVAQHCSPIVFLQNMLLSLMIFVTCVWDSSPASTKCSAQFLKQILKLQAEYPAWVSWYSLPSLIKPLIRDAITLSKDDWGVQSPPQKGISGSITILSFGDWIPRDWSLQEQLQRRDPTDISQKVLWVWPHVLDCLKPEMLRPRGIFLTFLNKISNTRPRLHIRDGVLVNQKVAEKPTA